MQWSIWIFTLNTINKAYEQLLCSSRHGWFPHEFCCQTLEISQLSELWRFQNYRLWTWLYICVYRLCYNRLRPKKSLGNSRMLLLEPWTAGARKEPRGDMFLLPIKRKLLSFNKKKKSGPEQGERWGFQSSPAFSPPEWARWHSSGRLDHTPSLASYNNNETTPCISDLGSFSSSSERDSSLEFRVDTSIAGFSRADGSRVVLHQQDTWAQVFGPRMRCSRGPAQASANSVNFLSLWLKLVSMDQQFDIFPLWCYIHVSTFNMSDWMNIVV